MSLVVAEPSTSTLQEQPAQARRTIPAERRIARPGAPRPGASPGVPFNATLVAREDLSPAVARFWVAPAEGVPAFVPGQYFALGLPIAERLVQRPYSTASPAGARNELEFLVRLVPHGTFTPRLWEQPIGGRLRIGPPKGVFALRRDDGRAHLFLATGTGVAPFVSMVATMLAGESGSRPARIVVVHGVSRIADLAYRDQLVGWTRSHPGVAYVPVISRPGDPDNADWVGSTGRLEAVLDAVRVEQSLDPANTVAYLCGNPEMITAGRSRLAALGWPSSALVSEHYWTARRSGDAR